jgi:hypothetical protein
MYATLCILCYSIYQFGTVAKRRRNICKWDVVLFGSSSRTQWCNWFSKRSLYEGYKTFFRERKRWIPWLVAEPRGARSIAGATNRLIDFTLIITCLDLNFKKVALVVTPKIVARLCESRHMLWCDQPATLAAQLTWQG